MEATIANSIEPGQKIIVGNNGIWGMRAADLASRYGGVKPHLPLLLASARPVARLQRGVGLGCCRRGMCENPRLPRLLAMLSCVVLP